MLRGIDVSRYQAPTAVPWEALAAAGGFCIVRMTYGATRDVHCAEHVRLARSHGVRVGAYHFFRASVPVPDQLAALHMACAAAAYGSPADIVPAVDWEDDTTARPIKPEHAPLAEELCHEVAQQFGQAPLLYITQRDWGRVGRPEWAFQFPLWVAHYSASTRIEPATPAGKPWAIWQHRVGPFDLDGPHGYFEPATYDHNVAQFLPLLDGSRVGPNTEPKESRLPAPPDYHDTEALRAARLAELGRQGVEDGFGEALHDMSTGEA